MKKVLYVEDSLASQALMRRFLSPVCCLETATSEDEAIARLEKETFSLLIFDYHLGQTDTLGLIAYIRKMADALTLPIIVLSSSMDRALTTKVIRAGANEAVPKPVNPHELRETVQKQLEAPYTHVLDDEVLRVFCMEWRSPEGYHQYSPEADLRVCGPTREAAAEAMADALRGQASNIDRFGKLSRQGITTHIVEFQSGPVTADLGKSLT